MPIYQTATYRIRPEGVHEVQAAIAEFVGYVRANEPGTQWYAAWQQRDDPTRFTHLFIFEDEAARTAHSNSDAVARFESVYGPHLLDGPVVFTEFQLVADTLVT
jgi:quinol monooxygenase YgiN